MTQDQLPAAAIRVLNCINQTLAIYFWKNVLQPRMPKDSDLDRPYLALENACVDSSLFALRAFDEFVRSSKTRMDDLVASDFPGLSLSSAGIDILERNKINKYIAHLTHLDLDTQIQTYSYRDCLAVVIDPAIAFCKYAKDCLPNVNTLHDLADGTKAICESVHEEYVSRPEAQEATP